MRQALEITRKELRVIFHSPTGWMLLLIFTLQMGTLLASGIASRSFAVWNFTEDSTSITFNLLFGRNGLIREMTGNLFLYIPLITMGLFSKEFSDGTIRLLFSSPVGAGHIIWGKYLSMMVYALALIGVLTIFGVLTGLYFVKDMDVRLFMWSALIFYMTICAYMAIGLFVSSLTSYQFVAALGMVAVLVLLNYLNNLAVDNTPAVIAAILTWLKGSAFIYWFDGYIGSWDIIYFLLLILLFLGFTWLRLLFMRKSATPWYRAACYILLLSVVLAAGYISSRPSCKYYIDARSSITRDVSMQVTRADMPFWSSFLKGGIPLMIAVVGSLVVIRRQRR